MKCNFPLAILLVSLVLTSSACSKNDDNPGDYGNHPRTAVPDDLVGYWLAGSTSIGNFWGYDGSYQGAAFELATGYRLYKDGRAREYFYYTSTAYNCRSQVLGYKEGTVEVSLTNNTITFYPASGNYRSFTCNGSGNGKVKQYGSAELYPTKKSQYKDIGFTKENGKISSWHIAYSDGSSLDFVKSQEPQK
ncbi:hypothetical protein [Paraflavitalea pollutisoli]|uniref:hypothetical protein n=1 Tax=Paraflavitalea pollutisoli TaxID=3034143 RepID=UPI0023EB786A|nr:hypothetical protein [Paraflavitalea sp. H1-2-19X]